MTATAVESAESALACWMKRNSTSFISDINIPELGLELVPTILQKDADAVVIMVSGQQTIDYAIEAMQGGACDSCTKPVNIDPHRCRCSPRAVAPAHCSRTSAIRKSSGRVGSGANG